MATSKRLRFEVFKRDKFTCTYCGRRPPDVLLEADHIVPRCDGGPDTIDNLATSCEACNRGKAGTPLGDVAPAIDELQLLEAIQEMGERARGLRGQMAAAEEARKAEDSVVEVVLGWWQEIGGRLEEGCPLRDPKAASVRRFLQRLHLDDIRRAIDATDALWNQKPNAKQESAWRYFCGTCWGMIRQQEGRH